MTRNRLKPEEVSLEKWAKVEGSYYSVSNMGRVRRDPCRIKGRFYHKKILNPSHAHAGIQARFSYRDGRVKAFLVRDLVAKYFLPPVENGKVIFIDGDETNLKVSNLKYVVKGVGVRLTDISKKEIIDELESYKGGIPRGTQAKLAKKYRVSRKTISLLWKDYMNETRN